MFMERTFFVDGELIHAQKFTKIPWIFRGKLLIPVMLVGALAKIGSQWGSDLVGMPLFFTLGCF